MQIQIYKTEYKPLYQSKFTQPILPGKAERGPAQSQLIILFCKMDAIELIKKKPGNYDDVTTQLDGCYFVVSVNVGKIVLVVLIFVFVFILCLVLDNRV